MHTIDRNGNTMWDLIAQIAQRFLSDHFRNDLPLRLICNRILIIKLRTCRQVFHHCLQQIIGILALQSRHRNNLRKVHNIFICCNKFKNFRFFDGIDLINNQKYRRLYAAQLLCNMLLGSTSHKITSSSFKVRSATDTIYSPSLFFAL